MAGKLFGQLGQGQSDGTGRAAGCHQIGKDSAGEEHEEIILDEIGGAGHIGAGHAVVHIHTGGQQDHHGHNGRHHRWGEPLITQIDKDDDADQQNQYRRNTRHKNPSLYILLGPAPGGAGRGCHFRAAICSRV